MRLREHKSIEKKRLRARPGFRRNTDLERWEYCHSDIVWRPMLPGAELRRSAVDVPFCFISYEDTWAEETI